MPATPRRTNARGALLSAAACVDGRQLVVCVHPWQGARVPRVPRSRAQAAGPHAGLRTHAAPPPDPARTHMRHAPCRMACYKLEEYETALGAFCAGLAVQPNNPQLDIWIAKCKKALAGACVCACVCVCVCVCA
jgi:hypothetical protein